MKNASASSYGISSDLQEAAYCVHCGEELNLASRVYSDGEYFCCAGCSAVYSLLNSLGLNKFYEIKEKQNIERIGRPINPESTEEYDYLDQENFINLYTSPELPLTMNFYIEGIHCGACLWLIEKIPEHSPYIESVTLDMSTSVATVDFKGSGKFSSFPEMAKRFGYRAHPLKINEQADELKLKENRKYLIRLSVAAVCAGNIMLLSAAIYSGADGIFAEHFGLLNLLLSLPVVTYCSYPFYRSVLGSLRAGRVTVDIPIAFVILVGFILSAFNYFTENDQVYFDSVTVFVFLLLASRYFLKSMQERINRKEPAVKSLWSQNRIAIWDTRSKQYVTEPIENLKPGQWTMLKKGERIPADGRLLSPKAELNLSVLTGENIPQTVLSNDFIYAGSILESDEAVIEVAQTGSSTRVGKLLDEVERNYKSKIGFSTRSVRFATIFTLLVGIIAVISFLAISATLSPSAALSRVMAFVLIACPCAFVFALPLSLGLTLRSAMQRGILVKNADILEKLPYVKNIFFDKTGTLTKGVYKILAWDCEKMSEQDQAAILAIEKESSHPVARAIVSSLSDLQMELPEVTGFKYIHTRGIEAQANGHFYELRSEKNINFRDDNNDLIITRIVITRDGEVISELKLGDSLKEDAKFVVKQLNEKGYNVHILSGDNKNNVQETASRLGVPESNIYWEQSPEEKSRIINNLKHTMMVGDGLNDTSAFSSADVAVSVQGSVEESLRVSDAYILNKNLLHIADLIEYGNITKNIIKRNTMFSIAYNITAGGFALLGYINPLAAAVLMPASSLLLLGSTVFGQDSKAAKEPRELS